MTNIAEIDIFKRSRIQDAKFSVMIPSWNNLEYVKLCVDSIRKNSSYKHQIIIHVNEGSDGTLEWVKQQDDIDYSYSAENIGICYALNSCRRLADTDYIMYMNDDMYVCPGWDEALVHEINNIGHNYFYISSTCIEPGSENKCMIPKDYGRDIKTFNEQALLSEFKSLTMHDWQGATWPPNIVHKELWDLAGGYSVEFSPGMYSDPDFSMKLWNNGVRYFKGVSNSRVYHFGSKSVNRVKKNQGYFRFISKWGITCSTLSKYYIKTGKRFQGLLSEASIPFYIRLKNFFKRIEAQFLGN
jgi:glycosyltransferase involved in cell wall biosynthesis